VRELRLRKDEISWLKRLLAERDLVVQVTKEVQAKCSTVTSRSCGASLSDNGLRIRDTIK